MQLPLHTAADLTDYCTDIKAVLHMQSLLKVLELRQSQIEVLSEVAKVDPDGLKPDLRQEMRSTAGTLFLHKVVSLTGHPPLFS